ncbi:hypothetical protein F5B22DRAFT_615734 [Xylaria bambusicola]|uniref:uncharacterized protein n=1 Tax=Xylaria bambusicola TaxID=326684 RepID=UPI0020083412|nr:uncharacterized protein F5B22DRAFT_615734 [Xylaria bambusicola]KAI0509719.1 hypothetical protein F5B22DRAFT_615734 [Xylaria bambusicola]
MPRQKSPAASPGAGNKDPSPTVSKKRATRPGSGDETAGKDSTQKRRRRAFSCLSCQRLKCRCEYDLGAQGCHRCQTLRITCSLRGETDAPQNPSKPNDVSRLGVEERLQRHEDALEEIKAMIKALKPERQSSGRSAKVDAESNDHEEEAASVGQHTPDAEYLLNPIDRGSKSAPVVVLREISQQVTLGYRRMLGQGIPDLLQLQLLDEQTASELIELFIKHQGHTLLVRSVADLRHFGDTRRVSAFLHGVCCLIGVVYRDDICGTALHRQLYEQIRITLGEAVLSSPLDLDDLNAMFIMSNNANSPSGQGTEYIDSWLLTGYCAKQAMLSICFTQIVDRLKKGTSGGEDYRAIQLWSTICLHHLHWAATTGRPSIIPKGYLNQCYVLHSFYRATIQDGMLVAEIMLYSTLHRKLLQESYPSDGRECEEFRTWKQKWNHLLALPTSAMLRVGYHAACLILAVRALEKTGDALASTSLLTTDSLVTGNGSGVSKTNDLTPTSEDRHDSPEATRGETSQSSDTKTDNAADVLRINACKYAKLVVETFLEMPTFLRDKAPTATCLCLGYCALVLSHYDPSLSQIPDTVVLRLVTSLDHWVQTSPGKAWSYKYGALAIRKVEARINSSRTPPNSHAPSNISDRGDHERSNERGAQAAPFRHSSEGHVHAYPADDIPSSMGHTVDPNNELPLFNLSEDDFPSMEGFFGGGFLDLMR